MEKDSIGTTSSGGFQKRYAMPAESLDDRMTSTEARTLVDDLKAWVRQFDHPEALKLESSLNDVKRLFVRVNTEIDEALARLSRIENAPPEQAKAHLEVAVSLLHRWQDRGGRIGNAGAFIRGVSLRGHETGRP